MFELRQTTDFAKWFAGLKDRKARGILAKRFAKMEVGHMGDVKPVGEGVSEIRVHFGAGHRVYFLQHGREIIFLLCGGDKGSQNRDIRTAKQMAKEIKDENGKI